MAGNGYNWRSKDKGGLDMSAYTPEELQRAKVSFGEARVALTIALNSAIEAYLGDDGAYPGDYTEEDVVNALWRAREAFESANGRWIIERDNKRITRLEGEIARLRGLLGEAREQLESDKADLKYEGYSVHAIDDLLYCIEVELSSGGKGGENGR
jgi:hypothetical protein